MHIVIAGAGALGSLLGAYLASAGEEVVLCGREAHVAAIRRNRGLRVSGVRGEFTVPLQAVTELSALREPVDLIVLGVKSQDAEEALGLIGHLLGPRTQIVTPQNGVAVEEMVAAAYGEDHNLAAMTTITANLVEPGHVFHSAEHRLDVGRRGRQDEACIRRIVETFNRAGIVAAQHDDIMRLKWQKLAIYCVGSILNAITGLQSLAEGDDIRELMRNLGEEIVAVVEAGHVTSFPMASVGQDLRKGKRTEIDYLNGYIVSLGRRYGVPTPVNHCIYALVKSMEKTQYLKR